MISTAERERAERELAEREAVVYLVYGADERLLYVGATVHLKNRLNLHRCMCRKERAQESGWYELADCMIFNGPGPRREMLELEARLIRELDPLYNMRGVRRRQRPEKVLANGPWRVRGWQEPLFPTVRISPAHQAGGGQLSSAFACQPSDRERAHAPIAALRQPGVSTPLGVGLELLSQDDAYEGSAGVGVGVAIAPRRTGASA